MNTSGQFSRTWNFAGIKTLIADAGHVANRVILVFFFFFTASTRPCRSHKNVKHIQTTCSSLVSKWVPCELCRMICISPLCTARPTDCQDPRNMSEGFAGRKGSARKRSSGSYPSRILALLSDARERRGRRSHYEKEEPKLPLEEENGEASSVVPFLQEYTASTLLIRCFQATYP